MKKNNIKQLKEIVSNEIFFDLSYQGVQAYNISANEYEVITGFWKCNGRYYFVDRDNNKYLASRYDRAEFIAGEMLEQKERENKMINDYIDSIEKSGEVKVVLELVYEYINTCEARGIDSGELVAEEEDAAGETYNVYRRESAADEQNNEQGEESAATCEPSMFAGILAKAKDFAQATAEKAGFVISLVIIFAVGLLSVCVAVSSVASIVEALGLLGSLWGALLGSVLVLTVGLDFMAFVVINAMAILSRFFPSEFVKAQKPHFTKPFSFWYRLITESL